jgi:hypothetical protein
MAAIQVQDIAQWRGDEVVDVSGQKLGTLAHVYYDAESDDPLFLGIRVGRLRPRLVLVPAEGARVGKRQIQIRRSKEEVDAAPRLDLDTELRVEDEPAVFQQFGLDYRPTNTTSGRRLIRR